MRNLLITTIAMLFFPAQAAFALGIENRLGHDMLVMMGKMPCGESSPIAVENIGNRENHQWDRQWTGDITEVCLKVFAPGIEEAILLGPVRTDGCTILFEQLGAGRAVKTAFTEYC